MAVRGAGGHAGVPVHHRNCWLLFLKGLQVVMRAREIYYHQGHCLLAISPGDAGQTGL